MEAWIVHISIDTLTGDGPYHKDEYTAWSTEKQAYKEIGKLLALQCDQPWTGWFARDEELVAALRALIAAEQFEVAVGLVNRYTKATPYDSKSPSRARSSGIHIKVTKSKFLGSVWE